MVHPTVDTPRITSTKKKQYTETTNNYGTILGEQYFIPIEFRDGSSSSCSVTTESTVASSTASSSGQEEHESLSLLLRSNTLGLATKRTSSDYIFAMFGFESNPMRSGDDNFTSNNTNNNNSTSTTTRRKKRRNTAAADLQLSMLSNFSTAYNVICISLALQMMKHVAVTTNDTVATITTTEKLSMLYHHMTAADTSMCSSALIAGMILGQLTLGTLGDVLGRHVAMSIVMVLQIIAAFGSSFSMSVPYYNLSIFHILAVWRFLLGLGCGGVYPLSATLTTESGNGNSSATTTTPRDRAKCVALTFSFQGFGYVIVPIVAYSIVQIFGESSDYGWRILLGLGSVPGIVLTIGRQTSSMQQRQQQQQKLKEATSRSTAIVDQTPINIDLEQPHHKIVDDALLLQQQEQQPQKNTSVSHRTVPISILDAILYERQLVRKLLGTAGCWLLFDILFYGNVLFQPVVLNAAFGSTNETISKMCYHAFLLAIMALPGYYISIFAVGRQSPRYIQIQGFFVMGLLYLTIGTLFDLLSQHSVVLLTIYGLTFFFSNYGPNTTTFMLPSMTFSKSCRSTLNGICAACGKAGALIGATIFVTASRQYGEQVVFFTCALLSFAGCLLTLLCVSGRVGQHTNADDEEEEYQRQIERTMNELNGGAVVSRRPVTLRMVYSHPSIFDSFPQD